VGLCALGLSSGEPRPESRISTIKCTTCSDSSCSKNREPLSTRRYGHPKNQTTTPKRDDLVRYRCQRWMKDAIYDRRSILAPTQMAPGATGCFAPTTRRADNRPGRQPSMAPARCQRYSLMPGFILEISLASDRHPRPRSDPYRHLIWWPTRRPQRIWSRLASLPVRTPAQSSETVAICNGSRPSPASSRTTCGESRRFHP
jgi:hypothetical protein